MAITVRLIVDALIPTGQTCETIQPQKFAIPAAIRRRQYVDSDRKSCHRNGHNLVFPWRDGRKGRRMPVMTAIQDLPGIGIKPVLSIKRHWRISAVVFIVIVLAGLPIAWIKGASTYSAESVFQVSPRYMKNLETDLEIELQSNSQYREFVHHLQNTVLRYDVLQEAVQTLEEQGIESRPPALSQREYIELLQRTLLTLAIPDTYMVRIRLNGDAESRHFLHEVVNSVTDSFLNTSKIEQIYGSEERFIVLTETQQQLIDENLKLSEQRSQLADRLGLTTFRDGVTNPFDILLAQLREKLSGSTIQRQRAEATLIAFESKGELPTELGRSILDIQLGDIELNGLRASSNERISQLIREMAGLGPKHPTRKAAEIEIRRLKEQLAQAEAEFQQQAYANAASRLEATVAQYRKVEEEIRSNVEQMEGRASEFAHLFQEAMVLTRKIDENQRRVEKIQKRINYLETESEALGFVRLVSPALPAETPMGIGKKKLLLVLLFAATAAALGLPIAIDLFDQRIRSVNDAEKLMGIPAAGWQIDQEDLATRLFANEQSRRFAATLIRNRANRSQGVFGFTSVNIGGGTTSTVIDVATKLADLGSRVLIVEANAFKPNALLGSGEGLTDLLNGSLNSADAIHRVHSESPNLHLLSVGTQVEKGIQRLDRLKELLQEWGAHYDFVLFDLPPVLLSADAEMLIQQIGQVFLVVQCESVARGEIARAKRLLQKIDPEAVGLFVNRVPLFRGGGGGYIEQSVIETLTKTPFRQFDAGAYARLQLNLLRTRWSVGVRRQRAPRRQGTRSIRN